MIIATILTTSDERDIVFIPRILIITCNYQFKGIQFLISLRFAMTINMSHEETFEKAVVDIRKNCFTHGQLYVVCSRISHSANIVILAKERLASNILYKETQ